MNDNRHRLVEPLIELNRVPIKECGEPLVCLNFACPGVLIAKSKVGRPGVFEYSPLGHWFKHVFVRKTIAEMLNKAQSYLPPGYYLLIRWGYRSLPLQRRAYRRVFERTKKAHPDWPFNLLRRATNRYVHPPDAKTPPPHSTGAAVDLTIAGPDHKALDMMSPFKLTKEGFWPEPAAFATACEKISNDAKRNRQILIKALTKVGLTNYPSEWWHWSYGDSGWAWRSGKSQAIYGAVRK